VREINLLAQISYKPDAGMRSGADSQSAAWDEPAVLSVAKTPHGLAGTHAWNTPVTPDCASKLKTALLLMAVVGFNALGNLALAWGMKHGAEIVAVNPLGYLRAMLHPFITVGTALLILSLLSRMALLSWADLSFVLPLTSVGYILAAVSGRIFLNEPVSPAQWIGTVLIFIGAGIVGTTDHKTESACEIVP
jgi:uncharacterized membrane protein